MEALYPSRPRKAKHVIPVFPRTPLLFREGMLVSTGSAPFLTVGKSGLVGVAALARRGIKFDWNNESYFRHWHRAGILVFPSVGSKRAVTG
jgi:hypothetical protein